ncbi:hypothetical protein ABZV14_31580 [Streptosporangium canum]|uniref:hypothetical protein n=1 Tax=Streptosporangium canum TaxID=324952 RepID=UPI0033B13DC1
MRPDSTALAGALVGAGTVLDAQQPVLAVEAGARFPACPALSAEMIRAARRHGRRSWPGHPRSEPSGRSPAMRERRPCCPAVPEDREQRPGPYGLTICFMRHVLSQHRSYHRCRKAIYGPSYVYKLAEFR